MKHELLYETQSDFTAAQGNSGNVTSITPGVAYIKETNSVPHFNKVYDNVTIVYNVADPSVPVKLYNTNIKNNLAQAFIDKTEVPVSSITNEYQFENAGIHHILLRYSTLTTLPDSAFTECTKIINIKLPDSLTKLGKYIFYGCTGIKKFVYPRKVVNIPAHAFHGCSNLERIYFKGVVTINPSSDTGHQYQFQGCGKLKHVYFNSIQQLCNSSFYGTKNEELFYHPCGQSAEGHLYIGGEEVFDVAIPEGVTFIGNSNFAFYKYLTAVTFSSTVKNIGNASFYKCSGVREWNFPSGLISIRDYTFYGCSGFTGSLILPDTVTSLGQFCFTNCSRFSTLHISTGLTTIPTNCFQNCGGITGLTVPSNITKIVDYAFTNCSGITGSLLIPSSVTEIGQYAFSGCTKVDNVVATGVTTDFKSSVFASLKNGANVYLKTTTGFWHSTLMNSNYGTVTLDGGWISRSANQRNKIDYFTFRGSYSSNNDPGNQTSCPYDCITFRVGGNLNASKPKNYFHFSGTAANAGRLKFGEIMGTLNETFAGIAYLDTSLSPSGCIYHLGYNGIACTPTQANVDYARLTKIYVGDGESQAGDQAVLDQYLADADWAAYSSKLDLWYNYHGEYREE